MEKGNTETTYEVVGTIERANGLSGHPTDFGTWNEQGCNNPILYSTEQEGMKQRVIFDLTPASWDGCGEGPITLTAYLEVTSWGGEPDETLVDRLVLRVQGLPKQEIPRDGSLFERFASAAKKIAALHFSRYDWDSAYEDQLDSDEWLDRAEHKGELSWK